MLTVPKINSQTCNFTFVFFLDNILCNAAVLVVVTFGAHAIKEISRTQLAVANKLYASAGEKTFLKLDKRDMILPVALGRK